MPVPTLVTDLSTTLASNSPAGSDNVFPDLDNYLRALSGFVASIRDNSGNGWVSPYLPLTYSAGTANGVLYLNGSKVVTTGSALTFDGANFATTGTGSATKFIPTGGSATGNGMYLPAANTLAWSNNGAETMRLDSSGNLGVGTSSPGSRLHVNGAASTYIRVSSTNAGSGSGIFTSNATNSYLIGAGAASGDSGLEFRDDTNGVTRMVLESNGNLLVGTTGFSFSANGTRVGADGRIWNTANSDYNLELAGSQGARIRFYTSAGGSGTTVGSVTVSTTATAYNTTSDRRLKENIVPAPSSGAVIDAIEIVSHDWKNEPDEHVTYGVIAQDLAQVAPQAVKAGDSGEEVTEAWGVDYSKLVPMLIKEIQSLRARVAALEAA